MTGDGTCGVFIPEMVVAGPIGRRVTGRGGWMHFPVTTISGINTPHISALVILHPPVLEDGTDKGFLNVGF